MDNNIMSQRIINPIIKTSVRPDGLDGYDILVVPHLDAINDCRMEDREMVGDEIEVHVYGRGDKDPTLNLLDYEARDLAIGILHALNLAGCINADTLANEVKSWSPTAYMGSTLEQTISFNTGIKRTFAVSDPPNPERSPAPGQPTT